MLTLAKLTRGRAAATYYLTPEAGQAIDAASLGTYYSEHGHARGRWHGTGGAALGLTGDVDPDAFARLLEGRDPATGEPLRGSDGSLVKVSGYDLTASAPKGVSLLWAQGDAMQRAQIEAARDAAVAATLAYLNAEACRGRRGKGGVVQVAGKGLLVAEFQHETARPTPGAAPDPNLHSHLIVANVVELPDGTWRTLDGSEIYGHYRTAGAVFAAALREEMSERLGVSWTALRKDGTAEVAGLDPKLLKAFSKRRSGIEAAVKAAGGDLANHEHRQAANAGTKLAKDKNITAEELHQDWREQAEALGWDQERLWTATRSARHELAPATDAEVIELLTETSSTFDRRALIRVLLETGESPSTVEARADQVLATAGCVELSERTGREIGPGGITTPTRLQGLYTSEDVLRAEAAVLAAALEGTSVGAGQVGKEELERVLGRERYRTIGADQRAMVLALTTSGDRVSVVSGPAGTGKTFALSAARETWESAGIPVIGATTSATAARELEEGAGIDTSTIASLLLALAAGRGPQATLRRERQRTAREALARKSEQQQREYAAWRDAAAGSSPGKREAERLAWRRSFEEMRGKWESLDKEVGPGGLLPGTVLVVDEAGMVGSKELARLTELVQEVGGKIAFVGDDRQMSAVAAGGLFRQLRKEAPHTLSRLTENRRQVAEHERETLRQLWEGGQGEAVVQGWHEHGQVVVGADEVSTMARMVEDYWSIRSTVVQDKNGQDRPATALMMAYRRDDVAALNAMAAGMAARDGELSGEAFNYRGEDEPAQNFRVGHRVACRRNNKSLEVLNGSAGTITELSATSASIRLDDGRTVELPAAYLAQHVELGYASTVHAAQGRTVDAGLLLTQGLSDSETLYVGMSRGRGSLDENSIVQNRLYVPAGAEPTKTIEAQEAAALVQLARLASNDGAELSAHNSRDQAREEAQHADLASLTAERARLRRLLDSAPEGSQPLRKAAEVRLEKAQEELRAALTRAQQARSSGRVNPALEAAFARYDQRARAASTAVAAFDGSTEHPADQERREWMRQHATDTESYHAIVEELDRRGALIARATSALPPAYLPERPAWWKGRAAWRARVVEIETYRARHGITDAGSPLGPEPEDRSQRAEWERLSRAAGHAAQRNQGPRR